MSKRFDHGERVRFLVELTDGQALVIYGKVADGPHHGYDDTEVYYVEPNAGVGVADSDTRIVAIATYDLTSMERTLADLGR